MKRYLFFLILFVSILDIIGSSLEPILDEEGDSMAHSVNAGESSVLTIGHDCPYQDNDHHNSDLPCSDDCHHHEHHHDVFISSNTKLSRPDYGPSKRMRFENFQSSPHPSDLFRPPIA